MCFFVATIYSMTSSRVQYCRYFYFTALLHRTLCLLSSYIETLRSYILFAIVYPSKTISSNRRLSLPFYRAKLNSTEGALHLALATLASVIYSCLTFDNNKDKTMNARALRASTGSQPYTIIAAIASLRVA